MKGYIYCITNDINNKQYVGKTTDSIDKRFKEHLNDATKERCQNRPLYRAINKYGKEHFSIKLLEECDLQDLELKEIYWINQLNTYSYGYNATHGGDGKQLYDYSIFIQDFNNGMSIRDIANKFQCDTDTVSNAISKAGLNTNLNRNKKHSHMIQQLTLDGTIIQNFNSCREAARYIKEQNSQLTGSIKSIGNCISRVANGQQSQAYNYLWKLL